MNDVTRLPHRTRIPAVADLERDIEDTIRQTPLSKPVFMDAVPQDVGRMSAEAVLAQYEVAAKSVEAMGNDVKDRISTLEAALAECDKDMKIIVECAAMIRDKGLQVKLQIEQASAVSHDIREACIEFKRKVGA